SLAALDHIDGHPLTFHQLADTGAVQRRGMHEDVLAAAVPHDEPESFVGVVPLDRADFLDRGLIGGLVRRPRGSGTPRRLLARGAGVDAQDLGYLLALLARPDPNLKRGARRHSGVAAALDHAHMKERITAIGKPHEAK